MVTYPLEDIIKLIEQGERLTARAMLEQILASEPHNLSAWACYLKTCTTDEECIKVLELCLQQNPENDQVNQELEKIRAAVAETGYSNDGYKTFTTIKTPWRFLNTFLFLVAFLAPWTKSCSSMMDSSSYSTVNGFFATWFMGLITLQGFKEKFYSHSSSVEDFALIIVTFSFIGLVCILVYALLYSLINFRSNDPNHFYLRLQLLVLGLIGMGATFVWAKGFPHQILELLWGYWLTWLVLMSSVLFEIINRLSQDQVNINDRNK